MVKHGCVNWRLLSSGMWRTSYNLGDKYLTMFQRNLLPLSSGLLSWRQRGDIPPKLAGICQTIWRYIPEDSNRLLHHSINYHPINSSLSSQKHIIRPYQKVKKVPYYHSFSWESWFSRTETKANMWQELVMTPSHPPFLAWERRGRGTMQAVMLCENI
jgi:hypothetical protein